MWIENINSKEIVGKDRGVGYGRTGSVEKMCLLISLTPCKDLGEGNICISIHL